MASGIYIAAAGAVAQSSALDVTANNIANASTAGFHGARVSFRQALATARSPDVALVGTSTGSVDPTAGEFQQTGNPLDIAIAGDGYLAVETARGTRYTRDGALQLDAGGRLVTARGEVVLGEGGPLTIPAGATHVAIAADGTVSADQIEIGKLDLVHLDPTSITHDVDNVVASSKPPLGGDPPQVVSGMLEGSNVSIVRGVVDLVKVTRTYESLMRVIEGFHAVETRAAQELGKPR